MSTPTTDADKPEKRPALEKSDLEFENHMLRVRALRDELNSMPATEALMITYEKLNVALQDEFDARRLARK